MYSMILNETAYVEAALRNHEIADKASDTLSRVAKYYHALGYTKKKIHQLLEEFIIRCDNTANIVRLQPLIEGCVKTADKRQLLEADFISVTQKELALVQNLQRRPMERLLFTMIVFAKFSNLVNPKNESWINRPDRELFRCANIQIPVKQQAFMLHDLRNLGLIRFSKRVDNINIQVLCVQEGCATLKVTDFRNLGFQYHRYLGESYFQCSVCEITVKRRSPNQKYCANCAIDMNRQKTLVRWKTQSIQTV